MCCLGVRKSDHPQNWFSGFHSLIGTFFANPMRYPICCQNCSETVMCFLSAVMVQLVSLWPRHPAFTFRTVLTIVNFDQIRSKSEIFFLAGRFSRSPCEITPRCRVLEIPEGRALSNGTTRSLWLKNFQPEHFRRNSVSWKCFFQAPGPKPTFTARELIFPFWANHGISGN